MNSPVLETERMLLRWFTPEDVDALYLLGTIPEIIKYTGNQPFASKEAARAYLEAQPLRDYQVYGYGRFALVWKETGSVIGFSGVKRWEEIDEDELGYRLLPEFWGKGLAKEAARVVIADAQQNLGLKRLVSVIHPENEASKNVVCKLGFAYEKDIRISFVEGVAMELFSRSI
ncbi:MAG: GNAT family N-acetyltransferase [Blastocatellia bacterium]|nr:GNAT family N-acetyltransferase [Blastocatellia bacterium]